MSVTVILNSYRRPQALREQYEAVKNQTYKHIEIMLWSNYYSGVTQDIPLDIAESCAYASCNKNLGVWARFAFALNAHTKYICVLDDDTIPGKRWIENCIQTMGTHRGLLGCRGVRMNGNDHLNYPRCDYTSIEGNTDNVERVDIMGHCWFFEREWLRLFWGNMPSVSLLQGGEDMHFSYVLQKELSLYTYVPPQPRDDKEMWGSMNASKYGEDAVATSRTSEGFSQSNMYWNFIMSKGYKLVKDSDDTNSIRH